MSGSKAPQELLALKAEVESAWNALIRASSEPEREKLRAVYRELFKRYRAQVSQAGMTTAEAAGAQSLALLKERPEIFRYPDYRTFMLDWFRYLKDMERLPIETLSQKSGVPVSELSEVFRGARRMRRGELQKLLPHLKLNADESAFLEQLRSLAEADTADEKIEAARKIQEFTEFRRNNPVVEEAWRYLSHWYYVAIREMSTLGGFRANVEWIKKRLRGQVLESEVRRAMEFLQKAGFYRKKEDESVDPLIKDISCMGGVYKVALGQFHREMLAKASEAIHDLPSSERWISGHTVALSRENYQKAIAILGEALEKIGELPPGERSMDDVYHVGLFAVPLTRSGGSET